MLARIARMASSHDVVGTDESTTAGGLGNITVSSPLTGTAVSEVSGTVDSWVVWTLTGGSAHVDSWALSLGVGVGEPIVSEGSPTIDSGTVGSVMVVPGIVGSAAVGSAVLMAAVGCGKLAVRLVTGEVDSPGMTVSVVATVVSSLVPGPEGPTVVVAAPVP